MAVTLLSLSVGNQIAFADSIAPSPYEARQAQKVVIQSFKGGKVLIVQDVPPWNTNSIERVLGGWWRIPYDIISSANIASTVLENYKLIIIASDQPQSFYDNYDASKGKFNTYVKENGGTLEFHASDNGWQRGVWFSLPGGVTHELYYDDFNSIYDDDFDSDNTAELKDKHPVVAFMPTPFYGTYASHGHFLNFGLITKKKVIVTRDTQDQPTTIEYLHGTGRVIATTNTLEYHYSYDGSSDISGMLLNLTEYALLKSKMKLNFEDRGWSNPLRTGMVVSQVFLDPDYDSYASNGSTAHLGIDIGAPKGTPVYSICKGQVVGSPSSVVDDTKSVLLSRLTVKCDAGGFAVVYGHVTNPQISLVDGTPVNQDQQIAEVREWGTNNSHLHLGINTKGKVYFATGWGFGRSPATATFKEVKDHGWRDPVRYLRLQKGP